MATHSGSLGIVEDPRPVSSSPGTHPYHEHPLVRVNAGYRGVWRCQLCLGTFDPVSRQTVRGPSQPLSYLEEDSPNDPTTLYNCSSCNFNVCVRCFKGHLHPFHHHRLRKAKPSLVYTDTDGQWKCDACQSVFSADVYDSTYHCSECEVDLCEGCFAGTLRHSLHKGHTLCPVDPRILYRTHLSWTCDNCSKTYSSTNNEIFFHCSQCMFDLCTRCYHGDKHHLHQHRLVPVPLANQTITCSNCHRQPPSYQCTEDECNYTICRYCHVSKPKPHPLHPHPLELCDAREIYPQSGGLWHCDNCTRHRGQQTPLPPREPMYHCDDCEFDLCERCYTSGLTPAYGQQHSYMPSYSHQPLTLLSPEHSTRPHQPLTLLSPSHSTRPHQPLTLVSSSHSTHTLCLVCTAKPATLVCVHGIMRCTDVPIVCQSCASKLLVYGKPCPYCQEVPDHVENIH